ncbi:MAG TPA: serine hydrolase [Pyrinomonadaceae bacterium]
MLSRITFVNAFVVVVAVVSLSACAGGGEQARGSGAAAPSASPAAATPAPPAGQRQSEGGEDAELSARLKEICARAGGECAAAVVHVETGRVASSEGGRRLPLYSVFKLPLAVAVLKDVEAGKLSLDQKVRVEPEEAAPGVKANSDLWLKPSERTVRELLEFSIVRSDNTSSDKMLELVGGPSVVTERMRALGLGDIEIRSNARDFLKSNDAHPNTGTATDLARLLARLQKGEVLAPPQLEVLLGLMGRAVTGNRRLRAGTPAGTPVADKTGSGPSTTNDVGLITLPEGRGHLAVVALVNGSKLSAEKQEDVIAELARAAYDAAVARASAGR